MTQEDNLIQMPSGKTWKEEAASIMHMMRDRGVTFDDAIPQEELLHDIMFDIGSTNIDWESTSPANGSNSTILNVHVRCPWVCPHSTVQSVYERFAIMFNSQGANREVIFWLPPTGDAVADGMLDEYMKGKSTIEDDSQRLCSASPIKNLRVSTRIAE